MIRSWRALIGFALSAIFIVAFFRGFDLGELWAELRSADYIYLFPSLAIYAGALLLRGYRWQVLLRPVKPVGIVLVSAVMVIGYMANNLLPVRTGEVVRAYVMGERAGISKMATLATILLERFLDVVALSIFLLAGALVVGAEEEIRVLLYVMTAATVVGLGALTFIATSSDGARRLVGLLVRLLPERLRGRAEVLAGLFLAGFDSVRSSRAMLVALGLTAGSWALEALTYYVLASAFEIHLGVGYLILLTAAANLAVSVPSSQGGIGPFEFFAKQALVFAGVGASVAGAYVVALHAILIVSTTVAGFLALWAVQISFRQVVHREAAPLPEVATK